jgi:hypothetical protein
MDRTELAALHDALGVMLAWPPAVFDQIARWITPEAAPKPNGRDPHPPPTSRPTRRRAGPRRDTPFNVKTAERRLLAAMQETPGLSVAALAKAVGSSRSATGARLQRLAERGAIEKNRDGRWRLAGNEPGATPAREDWRPTEALSSN